MKRIFALLLALVMLFYLTACGRDEESTPTSENTGATASTSESTSTGTVSDAIASDATEEYKILGQRYQTVVAEFLQDGYDVIDGLSSQVGANKTASERRAGWYKNISNFAVSIPNNLSIYTAYSVDEAAWVLMFIEDDIVVAYHVLLSSDPTNTVESSVKNSSFYEIKCLKNSPKMERLYGKNYSVDKEWDHHYSGRLVYTEQDYSVQAKVAKLDLANNAELTSNVQKMHVLEFYVEANPKSSATTQQVVDWRKAYLEFLEGAKDSYVMFALVYIDGDNIPELYLNGNCEATGDSVCTYHNGQVIQLQLRRTWGGSYIFGAGLIKNTNGNMGYYTTDIYRLAGGSFTNIWSGLEAQEIVPSANENDKVTLCVTFSIGNQVVSEEDYHAAIGAVFNTSQSAPLHENAVSYDDIQKLILER